jgi:hypothetical protein
MTIEIEAGASQSQCSMKTKHRACIFCPPMIYVHHSGALRTHCRGWLPKAKQRQFVERTIVTGMREVSVATPGCICHAFQFKVTSGNLP